MNSVLKDVSDSYKKKAVVDVKSGDTVRVHQKIKEGNKERVQVFEGLVIKVSNKKSQTSSILVRRQSGAIGVEKSYLLHSPLVIKIEVTKRGLVRRNYLTYMRSLRGKAARLKAVKFDRNEVNDVPDADQLKAEKEAELAAVAAKEAEAQAAKEAKQKAKDEAAAAKEADKKEA